MRIDLLARRWGGPDGATDGMAMAVAFLAWTLCEMGHGVRGYSGTGEPPWTHARMDWRHRANLAAPDDFDADLVITAISPAWRRTVAAAEAAGALDRLVFWHHHGEPPNGFGATLAAPPAVKADATWARAFVLPPSSWAVEARGAVTGSEILVPGASRAKGGHVALEVAHRVADHRWLVLPGRGSNVDCSGWRRLRHVEVASGHMKPADFLARARAVVSPTRFEVHPLTLLEAAVRGVPIVCSDLPSTRAATGNAATYVQMSAQAPAWEKALRDALSARVEPLALPPYAETVERVLGQLRPPARQPARKTTLTPALAPTISGPPSKPAPTETRSPFVAPPRALAPTTAAMAPAAQPAPPPRPVFAPPRSGRPRIAVLADVHGWAWERKALQLQQHLGDRFDIEVFYTHARGARPIPTSGFDIWHTFEVLQVPRVPAGRPYVTGITAHVWPGHEARYGAETIRRWVAGARAFHANSVLLMEETYRRYRVPIDYAPNGVDETFFRRTRPHPAGPLVVGWVGKPNPRKGRDLVAAACRKVGVELRTVDHRHTDAMPAEGMRDFYQGIHAIAVASDMDGTPNPMLEAAACSCAVVANEIGNAPELLDQRRNGILVDRTVESLAEAFAELAADVPRAIEMGHAARRSVEGQWTWRDLSRHYARIWTDALGKSSAEPAAQRVA